MNRTILCSSVLLLSCAPEANDEPEIIHLEAREQLIRLSVDLRGIHPTETELKAIETHPELYDDFVDRYLEDYRLPERVRQIFNRKFLTRTNDNYGFSHPDYSDGEIGRSIGEEPLRLISYIFENDLPYSEIVTADYTMANPVLAKIWNLDYPEGESDWRPARYQDSRPHAGILSMSSVWSRYPSMGGNANRHRANALSKMLLCNDYLSRPVVLSRAAVDQLTIDPEDAINTNSSCQSCHSSLDPLAAHFYGFFPVNEEEMMELYWPEREENWRMYAEKEPAYFGTMTGNITELGQLMGEDTRIVDCAVKTVMEGLQQREITDWDWTEYHTHRDAFIGADLSLRYLIRSIVTSDTYKIATSNNKEIMDHIPSVKVVNPYQLSAIMADITGFQWNFGGIDALTNNGTGIPVLLGGIDSTNVSERNYLPSVGLVFTQERLAQAAGWDVAVHDLDPNRTADARMLKFVSPQDTPDSNPEAFDYQIRELFLRVRGIPLADDATEPQELMKLWKQLHSVEASPTKAWAGVLSAVLRDPAIITY
ncbi:MAG: DUF1592 domain-containing protein [Myxococcota bacterium]|nr:DUF1592 domain-containing protein [Myxococcota bacterium]